MLHAGLDLSRRRLDVCLLDEAGELVAQTAAPPDADGLRRLAERLQGERVRAVIESMTGARFVHDTLEEHGWEVLVADAQKVKGLAPLACKTDKIDARVLAELSWRDLVPAVWLPDPSIRRERELARYRLHLVRHRTTLKNRIHATLMTLRASVPGLGSVRARRPRAARPPADPRSVAPQRRREPGTDRRPRSPDRAADRRAAPPGRRSPLHPAAGHRARVRLDQRLHRRLRDRRHQALRLAEPSSAATPGSAHASTNPATPTAAARSPSRDHATCAGRCSKPPCTPATTRSTPSATSAPSNASAANAAPKSPRSTSPASSPRRSGTCSPAISPSLRQAPVFV